MERSFRLKAAIPSLAWMVLALCVALLAALFPRGSALAAERYDFPEETPGPPYYARISTGGVPHTDEWAAVLFYRDPACVPTDFNLLEFFDIPRAFGCPLTVEGFEIWENGPGEDPAPMQVKSQEAGPVPVWFVAWSELEPAMADGVLTITELAALPSLTTGLASRFNEVLHPTEGAQHASIRMIASGTLSDGRSFKFQAVAVESKRGDEERHVLIEFD